MKLRSRYSIATQGGEWPVDKTQILIPNFFSASSKERAKKLDMAAGVEPLQDVSINILVHKNQKIDVIRAIRIQTDLGLKDAKDLCDYNWNHWRAISAL